MASGRSDYSGVCTGNQPPFEIQSFSSLDQHGTEPITLNNAGKRYMLVWIKKGSLRHIINSNCYKMGAALYAFGPGQMHQMLISPDTEGHIIYFSADCISSPGTIDLHGNIAIFYTYPDCFLHTIKEENNHELSDIVERIYIEYSRYSLLRFEIITSYLRILLTYLKYQTSDSCSVQSHSRGSELARKFFSLLNNHFKAKKQVADYASEMAITANYLNWVLKKETGMTARDHIKQRIIIEAKRQAVHNGLNMKETAYMLGFDDMSHFSKYFKNATGINFSDFKKDFRYAPGN